jgi:hypothetical protein
MSNLLHDGCLNRPKHRINSEFAHFVNKHDEVMTENFVERFVGTEFRVLPKVF